MPFIVGATTCFYYYTIVVGLQFWSRSPCSFIVQCVLCTYEILMLLSKNWFLVVSSYFFLVLNNDCLVLALWWFQFLILYCVFKRFIKYHYHCFDVHIWLIFYGFYFFGLPLYLMECYSYFHISSDYVEGCIIRYR